MASVPGFAVMKSRFAAFGPSRAVVAITKDDDADLPDGICMAVACGTAGSVQSARGHAQLGGRAACLCSEREIGCAKRRHKCARG